MPKKKEKEEIYQQLDLFDNSNENLEEDEEDEENYDEVDLDADVGFTAEETDTRIKVSQELITLKLLRQAIAQTNPDDIVMRDFGEYVLPNLLRLTIGVPAKGGKFFDQLDRISKLEYTSTT